MSKRLQVIMSEAEYEDLESAARSEKTTVSEWVRAAIRVARRGSRHSVDSKLKAIASGYGHSFPTADIDEMLAQVESGYR